MNKKGQALVEFIIILPVFIFMLLAMIDIGKILYFNNKIESKMDDVITMYENKYQYEVIKKSISKDLQNRGMTFVGSVIIYSYLQAIGVIYSHDKNCFMYKNGE